MTATRSASQSRMSARTAPRRASTRSSSTRSGVLWAWTAVTAAPPGYEGPVPYGFGVVELPEGVRIITRLTEADPAKLTQGQTMVLVLDPLVEDAERRVLTYAFAPADRPKIARNHEPEIMSPKS